MIGFVLTLGLICGKNDLEFFLIAWASSCPKSQLYFLALSENYQIITNI